ncbi:hypothetical protein [Mucilaginibacter limnophilus]|uniref:hypothetical protein n=1 Tax=Mucilaginibacter limnophilus TaxID=1932778 RepID=UPI0013E30377|nr:hypothetical protein [Mucilaginibacter limnophilus]
MSYRVVFSKYALETFDDIKQQIQQRWGQHVVTDFEQRTLKALDLIAGSPLVFSINSG